MPIQSVGGSAASSPGRQQDAVAELRDHANRAVMNKELTAATAPPGLNLKNGVSLQVSQRDQRENGVLSRTAYAMEGQVFVQEEVMKSNGDIESQWKQAKRAFAG